MWHGYCIAAVLGTVIACDTTLIGCLSYTLSVTEPGGSTAYSLSVTEPRAPEPVAVDRVRRSGRGTVFAFAIGVPVRILA